MAVTKKEELETKKEEGVNEGPNDPIKFKPFFDGKDYKDDLVVTINGVKTTLKRGVWHTIPRYVYNNIMQDEQDAARTNEKLLNQQRAFAASSKNI